MRPLRRSSLRAAGAALLVAGTLLGPGLPAQAALPGITIRASVGICNLYGTGISAPMTATIRDANDKRKGSFTADLGSGGSWAVDCDRITLLPHDKVILTDTTSDALLQAFTVPLLTLSLDRGAGRLTGDTSVVSSVLVHVYTCPVHDDDCSTDTTVNLPVATDGRWTLLTAGPQAGWNFADVTWTSGFNQVSVFARFPRLVVTLGSARVAGSGNPGGPAVAVAVSRRGKAVASASAKVSGRRTFVGTMRHGGSRRALAAGDRVRWSIGRKVQASFTIPAVRARATTTHLTGRCLANQSVVARALSPDGKTSAGYGGTALADGTFDIAWSVTAGWHAWAECQTAQGDVIRTKRVTVK